MTGPQIGAYGIGEVEYLIRHNNTVLLEVDDVGWDFDAAMAAGGAGLGTLQNTYHKRTGPPSGSWSMSRKLLQRSDNGALFEDLLAGSAYIVTDEADAAAVTLTTSETLVSMLQVQERTSGTIWKEGVDFTVNYATNVVTFVSTVPAGGVEVKYLTTTAHMKSQNLVQNSGIEAAITNIWEAFATATVVRTTTAAQVRTGSGALSVTPAAQHDGVGHSPNITVIPGRAYRFRFWAKGTAAQILAAHWEDAGGVVAMTIVSPAAATLVGADWEEFDFTFTPNESTILNIFIKCSHAAPVVAYIDDLYLGLNAPTVNVLEGQRLPFQFEIVCRRVVDQVELFTLKKCCVYKLGGKSGELYTESLGGEFLEYTGQ